MIAYTDELKALTLDDAGRTFLWDNSQETIVRLHEMRLLLKEGETLVVPSDPGSYYYLMVSFPYSTILPSIEEFAEELLKGNTWKLGTERIVIKGTAYRSKGKYVEVLYPENYITAT